MQPAIDVEIVEPLEGLPQNRSNDGLVEAIGMREAHNVEHTASAHETSCNVQLAPAHPTTTHAQHVGMFGQRHELRLAT